MKKAGAKHKVETLVQPREFEMAAKLAEDTYPMIKSENIFTVDTELHIRHGSSLTLRGVLWLVTDQTVGQSLLRRPVLDFLRLDTREILAAAADRYSGAAYIPKIMDATPVPTGRVAKF